MACNLIIQSLWYKLEQQLLRLWNVLDLSCGSRLASSDSHNPHGSCTFKNQPGSIFLNVEKTALGREEADHRPTCSEASATNS